MPIEKPYVCVSTRDGEILRNELLKLSLLDLDFKITAENGNLYFPLKRLPTENELSKLQGMAKIRNGVRFFSKIREGPRTLTEFLKDVIPAEKCSLLPRAFDTIGDIAVLEIPEELNEYRYEIGWAFHSLHKNFATVLVKRSAISGITRLRKYEFLSGVNKTTTVHTEYGCKIAVDLSQAYFSPRLHEEHNRVASLVKENEVVLDMFTGVGPFALHIARRRTAKVFAIDINPNAIALLKKSMMLNRLRGTIVPVVADAHEYVKKTFNHNVDRIIMNHPSGASAFVRDACTAIRPDGIIHYYDFMRGPNPEKQIKEKITKLVQDADMDVGSIPLIKRVRNSAPYEFQMVADVVIQGKK